MQCVGVFCSRIEAPGEGLSLICPYNLMRDGFWLSFGWVQKVLPCSPGMKSSLNCHRLVGGKSLAIKNDRMLK